MKRMSVLLLALCLLCGTASAEGLRVLNMGFAALDEYREVYPDRAVDEVKVDYFEDGHDNAQEILLQHPGDWDVAYVWTDKMDLAAMDRAGVLMDLSGEGALSDYVGGMFPAVRQAVTEGGCVLAVPTMMFGCVMQLSMASVARVKGEEIDIIEPLGLTTADAPRTFDALCALAQRYMAIPKETRKGTVFNYDAAVSGAEAYFLQYLIELYRSQYTGADGSVTFDTPVFRQALEGLGAMADALKSEKKLSYGQGGTLYSLINDSSSSLLSGTSRLLYLRVGENANMPARLGVFIVNANTPSKNEALDLIACSMELYSPAEMGPLLLEAIDYDALARRSYDENIKAQVYQKEDQSVIDRLTKERDSGVYPRYYTRESIADYAQNVAPHLTFPRLPYLDSYAIAKEYAQGKLDAEGLIEMLNGLSGGRPASH